jgi:hypothetical protein
MTFYEQVGIVIPGSVLMVGLLSYFPSLNALVAKDGITLGQFGIFLLLSYGTGHFIAALGNVLETVLWRPFGGMPSDWVTKQQSSLLSPQQIVALETKVTSRFNVNIGKLPDMDRIIMCGGRSPDRSMPTWGKMAKSSGSTRLTATTA